MKILFHPILLFAIAIGAMIWTADRYAPPQHLPWKALDLNRPVGFATQAQLFALQMKDRKYCVDLLTDQASDTVFTSEGAFKSGEDCGWTVAVNSVSIADIGFSPPEMKSLCPMSAASYIWIGEIKALSEEIFGQELSRIHHFGTYSCRNIAGSSQRSEHAFANAWDIAAFELADGTLISVQSHWTSGDDKSRFLKAARDKACRVFRTTLSPDYNAAHADHFHVDMGPVRSCR